MESSKLVLIYSLKFSLERGVIVHYFEVPAAVVANRPKLPTRLAGQMAGGRYRVHCKVSAAHAAPWQSQIAATRQCAFATERTKSPSW
jgi:hypothetical protein